MALIVLFSYFGFRAMAKSLPSGVVIYFLLPRTLNLIGMVISSDVFCYNIYKLGYRILVPDNNDFVYGGLSKGSL